MTVHPPLLIPAAVPVPVTADRAAIVRFLCLLWPEGPGKLYLCVWSKERGSRWFGDTATEQGSMAALEQAADYIAANPTNCYIGMCLSDADHGPHQRLSGKEGRLAYAAPGVWLDADIQGPGHQSSNRPESIDRIVEILRAAGLAKFMPTFAVLTGGGTHLHWSFKEPWFFQAGSDPKFHERARFASILRRLQRLIRDTAATKGFAMDATHDLERVLRPAGTIRSKDGCAPVRTEFYAELSSGNQYDPSDWEQLLDMLGVQDRHENRDDAPSKVGVITVNPRATIPPEELQALLEANPAFSQVWHLQRNTGKSAAPEDSFSERDMQLAGFLAYHAGFDAQRITDWLIHFRREKAKPGHTRAKHLGYYEITVGKALDFANSEREKEERRKTADAKKDADAAEAAKIAQQEKRATESQDAARAVLKDVLQRDITRMLVLIDNEERTYQLELDDGQRVNVGGIGSIYSADVCSRQVWESTGRAFPPIKKKSWVGVVLPAFHILREEIEMDLDHGRIRRWLRSWFMGVMGNRICKTEEDWADALATLQNPKAKEHEYSSGAFQAYGDDPKCILRAHILAHWIIRFGDEGQKESTTSIRKRLLDAGFVRPKESITITVGDQRFKLRDVYFGDTKLWYEGPELQDRDEDTPL